MLVNFTGVQVFGIIGDPHRQRDGILESEDARLNNMVERICHAAAELAFPH